MIDMVLYMVYGINSPLVSEVQARFTTTRAGNPVLIMGGYRFNRARLAAKNGALRWTCSSRALGCPAKVVTCDDQVVTYIDIHSNHRRFGKPAVK